MDFTSERKFVSEESVVIGTLRRLTDVGLVSQLLSWPWDVTLDTCNLKEARFQKFQGLCEWCRGGRGWEESCSHQGGEGRTHLSPSHPQGPLPPASST